MRTASLTDAATVDAVKACLLGSSTQLRGWLPSDLLPPALDEFIASANAAPWHQYTDNGERGALAYLSIAPWDESFFRLKMAEVHLLGDHSLGGTTALLSAALQAAQSCGVEHLRIWLPSSSDALRKGLAPLGFKPAWETVRIASGRDRSTAPLRTPREVTVRLSENADMLPLTSIVEEIEPYCWPQLNTHLPADARAAYAATRLRNCIMGGFADVNTTLVLRGRAIGFNGSSHRLPDPSGSPRVAYERDTFISPSSPPGLGTLLLRGALGLQPQSIRVVTGRVRLDGEAMIAAARRAGFSFHDRETMFERRL